MLKAGRLNEEGLILWLKKDVENQKKFFKAYIDEKPDTPKAILYALRMIAKSRGYETFTKEAGLSDKVLYKILSPEREMKPRFETINRLIAALGLRFIVAELPKKAISGRK